MAPVCFVDRGLFVTIAGLCVTGVAYLSPCLARRVVWLQFLAGALLSILTYALLAAFASDTFGYGIGTSLPTVAGFFLVFNVVAALIGRIFFLGVAFLLLGPIAVHNTALATFWLQEHVSAQVRPWMAAALLGALVLALLVALYLAKAGERVLLVAFPLVTPVALYVHINALVIVEGPARESREFCCDWTAPYDVDVVGANSTTIYPDNQRCPLGFDDVGQLCLAVLLVLFSAAMLHTFQTKPAATGYQRVDLSPSPPPPLTTTTTT